MKIKNYWREITIGILILLIILPFWRNYMKAPCPTITDTVVVSDTCWMTAYVDLPAPVRYIRLYDGHTVRDTVYQTIFGPVAAVDSTDRYQSAYIDTISIGAHRLAYAHLVTGTLDSSIYDLFVRPDTIYREITRPTVEYREPWAELSATLHSQGNNAVPGIMLKSRRVSLSYGFDIVQGRHNIGVGYRFWKF